MPLTPSPVATRPNRLVSELFIEAAHASPVILNEVKDLSHEAWVPPGHECDQTPCEGSLAPLGMTNGKRFSENFSREVLVKSLENDRTLPRCPTAAGWPS
jgi:hypothetical protein